MDTNKKVAIRLLEWFQQYGRIFPFRWQEDPYRILVAGILLRQTQAVQVASVYPELIEAYPSISSIANANEETLRIIIKPLGILSRARLLIKIGRDVLKRYNGIIPSDYQGLIELPGIGDYIASCILTIAFKEPRPMIDVNVKRVIDRIYCDKNLDHRISYNELCLGSFEEPFHYAILDLAQLICRKFNPKCIQCPIFDKCVYYKTEYSNP